MPINGLTAGTGKPIFGPTTILNGTPVVVNGMGITDNCTVWVEPNGGDTIRVEATLDGVRWDSWPPGDVTAYTTYKLVGNVVALRFTRSIGTSVLSRFGGV